MVNLQHALAKQQEPLNVIYISSYIPRKCGIATYTKDLTNAINMLNSRSLAEILAVTREDEELDYPWEAKFKIDRNDLGTYIDAAEYINHSHADIVSLQHEFGLFGGEAGEYIVPLVESITVPVVTTFHTILSDPTPKQIEIIQRVAKHSRAIVVMMHNVADQLTKTYRVPKKKIVVIPHGVPDFPFNNATSYKKQKRLSDRLVLGNINLLAPNKGIEYALEAIALIAKHHPEVMYLVIGQTHPELLRSEGERYRLHLKKLTRELKITKNVRFINKYLSLDELIRWLKTIDIYITPYLDLQQVTSGALAYAIGAGKPCISTPYIYAQEVLAEGRGVIVPVRNSAAVAASVLALWKDPKRREEMKRASYRYGRLMTWPNVAHSLLGLFRTVVENHQKKAARQLSQQLAGIPVRNLQPSVRP